MFGFKKDIELEKDTDTIDNGEEQNLASILGAQSNDTNITAGVDAILDEDSDILDTQTDINTSSVDFSSLNQQSLDEEKKNDYFEEFGFDDNNKYDALIAETSNVHHNFNDDDYYPEVKDLATELGKTNFNNAVEDIALPEVEEDIALPEVSDELPEVEDLVSEEVENITLPEIEEDITLPEVSDELPEVEDLVSEEVEDIALPEIEEDIALPEVSDELPEVEDLVSGEVEDIALPEVEEDIALPEVSDELPEVEDLVSEEVEDIALPEIEEDIALPEVSDELPEVEDLVSEEVEDIALPEIEEDIALPEVSDELPEVEDLVTEEVEDIALPEIEEDIALPEVSDELPEAEDLVSEEVEDINVSNEQEEVSVSNTSGLKFIPAAGVEILSDNNMTEKMVVEPENRFWNIGSISMLSQKPKEINIDSGLVTWNGDKYQNDIRVSISNEEELKEWSLTLIDEFSVPLSQINSEIVIEKDPSTVRYAGLMKDGVEKLKIFNQTSYKFVVPQGDFFTVQGNVICGKVDETFSLNVSDFLVISLNDKINKYIEFTKPMSGFIVGPKGVRVFFANAKGVVFALNGFVEDSDVAEFFPALDNFDNKACFVFGDDSEEQEFIANNRKNLLVVNVGPSLYGWNIRFDNDMFMSLRDALEYQTRYKNLPSNTGTLMHGKKTLNFFGVESIKIREKVVYYSYGRK